VSHFFFIGREDRVRGERGRRWLEGKRENERQTGKKTETWRREREKKTEGERDQKSPGWLAELSTRPDLIRKLVPPHAEPALRENGIELDGFVPIPLEQMRITLD
jgi:hypothetical protein